MLRIRLLRVGKKNSPSFRLVVTPRRTAAKTGKFLEILGFYNPLQHTKDFKKERIQYWLSMGAQPSGTVHNLLIKEGISEGAKIAVHKRAKEEVSEEAPKGGEQKEPAASPPEADKQAGPPQSSEAGLGGETTPAEATVAPETKESEPETPEPEPDSVEAKSDTVEGQAPKENVQMQESAPDEEKQVKE